MTKEEMKNKYSNFITEISEILGLGKPIDILKLCATTELFFQPLEKRIEELEQQIEKLEEDYKVLQTSYNILKDNDEKIIKEMGKQIEKMKQERSVEVRQRAINVIVSEGR